MNTTQAKRSRSTSKAVLAAIPLLLVFSASAKVSERGNAVEVTAPPNNPTQVFWGDTHLHTNRSVDANGLGNRMLNPEDAYRFARGESVTGHSGLQARLARPLDFIVIADHAVNMGVLPGLRDGDPRLLESALGKKWHALLKKSTADVASFVRNDSQRGFDAAMEAADYRTDAGFFWKSWTTEYFDQEAFRRSTWASVCESADRNNMPGEFTAFIGYEWTPRSGSARSPNFHRNVIFRGDASSACLVLPFSVQDSENVEDLWRFLQDYEDKTGDDVLAIPHNGNLSNGMMFKPETYSGATADRAWATTRAKWEPLYEVTQIKGDSETHPATSPDDIFADFETWHRHGFFGSLPEDFEAQKRFEYARPALKVGLETQRHLGVNPFKFGFIGSSDAHTSLSTVAEDNFWGKVSLFEPSRFRLARSWQYAASGLAAVWAAENTRESLFDAMERKEVYATTGTRISLRFFGSWEFTDGADVRHDAVETGYRQGVPMGADLTAAEGGVPRAPRFMVLASKDPEGANLDRIQIIKGWLAADGRAREKVYTVALGMPRTGNRLDDGILDVGTTVDTATATYKNSIGSAVLSTVWQDPDFDPAQSAFYYARVIEIPTPRWTNYDLVRFGLSDEELVSDKPFGPEGTRRTLPVIVRERAYSSPIWYSAESR